MKLYEITNEYQEILESFREAETEEELASIADRLAKLDFALEDKLDNCARVLRTLEAEAEIFNLEASRLYDKSMMLNNRADRFKGYIAMCLGEGNQMKTKLFNFKWLSRKSVDVINPSSIPEQYQRVKTTIEPDKKLIMQDLENGAEIPGARIITKHHLQIK